MARKYRRDARGRFAGGGYSGQTSGRGARLKSAGKTRAGGGAKVRAAAAPMRSGTIAKGGNGVRGSVARSLAATKRGRVGASSAAKPPVKTSRPDLSQAAFERRARVTEKMARSAEKAVAQIDRYNPANRRLVNRANSLRSAADSYASYARRGKTDPDFSAEYLFQKRTKSTTAPKLTRSEKAAATRRANADKRFRENVRRMEAARR